MTDFMDLVICNHQGNPKSFIFRAPAWSNLKAGDKVIVETKKGESEATVVKSYTIDRIDKSAFDFILTASGVSLPLKRVLKKVTYKNFIYTDEGGTDEKSRPNSKA